MRAWRLAIGGCGLAAGAYGFLVMAQSGPTNIIRTLYWVAGGVIAHDALLAPATLVVAFIAVRLLPPWVRGPAAIGLVVLGSLTLIAIPVLGRFGARPDNPSLLDRNYTAGWLAVAAVTVLAVGLGAAVRRHSVGRAGPADEGGES